jgi:hypothetical protein
VKPWKLALGAGAACAACCAAPIISATAALGLGTSGLFAGGMGALGASNGSWVPLAAAALALAGVGGLILWRRRPAAQRARGQCGCSVGADAAACRGTGS